MSGMTIGIRPWSVASAPEPQAAGPGAAAPASAIAQEQAAVAIEDVSNTLAVLMKVAVAAESCEQAERLGQIQGHAAAVREATRLAREAAEAARKAAQDKSFWSGLSSNLAAVAKVAAVGAAAASVVASGGVSTVAAMSLAGVLLSTGAKPLGDAVGSEELGKMAGYAGLALSLAAGGAALFGGGAALDPATLSEAGKATCSDVRHGFMIASGAAKAGGGAAQIESARSGADGIRHQAQVKVARAQQAQQRTESEADVQALKGALESFGRAKEIIMAMQGESAVVQRSILSAMGRRA